MIPTNKIEILQSSPKTARFLCHTSHHGFCSMPQSILASSDASAFEGTRIVPKDIKYVLRFTAS
jgi:hypothetical protein